jgi:hypothetical protein
MSTGACSQWIPTPRRATSSSRSASNASG